MCVCVCKHAALLSHPGFIPALCPVFMGVVFGAILTRIKMLLKMNAFFKNRFNTVFIFDKLLDLFVSEVGLNFVLKTSHINAIL